MRRIFCAVVLACVAFARLAQSAPDLLVNSISGSQFRLSWAQTPGFRVLEETDTLGLWQPSPQTPTLSEGRFSVMVDMAGASSRFFRLRDIGTVGTPPDPASVASPIPQGVATLLAGATEFLYTGPNPIQTGMALGTIEARRVAILRGKAVDRSGAPVPGVRIMIPDHPEFGQTLTRVDGMFDLAVNGGGPLKIDYTKAGYLPAQRQVNAPWQDYVRAPDVALIALDTSVTTIVANAGTAQVHRSTVSTDSEGSRCASLLFPAGTTATMVMADGTTQPLTNLDVRASEYTVGANGPMAMPGELPPTSGYTYAVEFSVDQAVAANADTVTFNQPIPTYVENFLGFPVGENVPLGYYDRKAGVWVPSANGRVIKITAISGGIATVDTVGSRGLPAMVIDSAELETLGSLYPVGQELWRMPVTHFSAWDANWGISPPSTAASPPEDPDVDKSLDEACTVSGNSVIEVQNQILGETIGVVGTPFGLQYQSDRVPGRKSAYDVDVPLSGATLPGPVVQIELEVQIAGRFFRQSFPPVLNQKTTFTWDGRDAYGRTLQGSQFITVRTGYTYDAVYQQTPAFGYNGNGQLITGSRARQQVTLWRSWQGMVGTWDARASGLGGWTLSAHHTYDPIGKILYRGDGGRQSAQLTGPTIHNFAGTGLACAVFISGDFGPATKANLCPTGVAAGPDGSVYIVEASPNRVRRVHPDGIITTVAGTGETCYSGPCGDGGPATEALLGFPHDIAIGPDNSLYVSDQSRFVVRRVGPDGIITTFAGTAVSGSSGDGGPATQARIGQVLRLAAGPDGSVFIADELNNRIRRVGTDGIITTVAGTGVYGFSGEGIPATLAKVAGVHGIAVGRDGSLYLSEIGLHRVRRVTPDGIIRTIAGTGTAGFSGDGGPATQARLNMPTGIAVDLHDNVYFMDQGNRRIRWFRPGGTIATLAGNGITGPIIEGAAAQAVPLDSLTHPWLAVGPDGSVYFSHDSIRKQVRRITPAGAAFGPGGLVLPNPDGSEVYIFGSDGRHSRTVDALTGALREEFGYDSAGRLASVTDVDGNITSIERDAAGLPIAIVGPFGQRTTMAVNPDGFLSAVTSPAGETLRLAYTTDGLLTSLTNPRGHTSSYAFDTKGRLTSATDPTGATRTLGRAGTNRDYSVALTSPLGRTATYRVERLGTADMRLTTNNPAACQVQTLIGRDGTKTTTFTDGTTISLVSGPDPRWGMQAPLAKSVTLRTPAGLVHTTTRQRTVTLAAPADLLSLKTFTETVTVNGRVFRESYDATTRTFTQTLPTGRQSTATIDARGRMAQTQFGGLAATGFTYDSRGRLATITHGNGADSRTTTFAYGGSGFLQSVTDPAAQTKSSSRDADGRVTELTFPDGAKPQFGYDANGNITTLRPPGRPDHLFAYTPNNQVSAYTAPMVGAANNQTLATYDKDRQPTVIDRPDGQSVLLDYDAEGRLILVKPMAGDIHYGHDTCGRRATLNRDQGANLSFTYDGKLPIGTTSSGAVAGNVTRAYDNDFRVASFGVNGGSPITLTYDEDGLFTQVGDLTLTRNAQNGLVTATVLGSVTDTTAYDAFGAPAAYTASQGGNVIYSTTYTRDALDRIATKVETIGGVTHTFVYTYDLAGRLAEVRQDNVLTASYTYDPNGNRLTRTDGGGTMSATYDVQDRLDQFGTTTYVHNAAGERQSKTVAGETTSYQYDSLGNLTGVTLPGGAQIEYVLDGRHRRVGKKVNGTLLQGFLYQDALKPVAELDGNNNVISRFVYAAGVNVPAYMIEAGVTYRIITDHLGSPRLVIDAATGSVAQRLDYDEFGNVILDTNPGFQPFGFAGGLYDGQTGLVHFGAREYDPETGRWTSKDPIGFGGGDPNLYGYVFGDPVNSIDPFGLFCDGGFTCGMLLDEREMLEGRMSTDEYRERQIARGVGGILGVAAVATALGAGALVEGVESVGLWLGSRLATCSAGSSVGGTVATTGVGGTAASTARALADTLPGVTALYAGLTPGQLSWIQRMAETIGLAQQRIAALAAGDQAALDRIASTWSSLFHYAKYVGQ